MSAIGTAREPSGQLVEIALATAASIGGIGCAVLV